jgi:CRP/FNR family transcriptional activator FtrB
MSLRDSDFAKVRGLPLFHKCNDETFATVISGAFLQRFPAGTTLLMESDSVDFLYILLDGTVELGAGWKSKDTTLAILKPVSTFILAAVVLDADALMSAVTLERSEILMIPGGSFRKAMRQNAEFGFSISEEISGCYRGLVRSIKNQKLRTSTERLANYLLTQRARQDSKDQIILPYEKRVLASLLGMTPENLSRAFANLANQGVSVDGSKVIFSKLTALERLARPSNMIDNHFGPDAGMTGKANTERQRGGFGVN